VIRAAVETVAENTSDGFVAPLFWAALGGVPMALAYKAINTLDSMVGYRDHRYRWFGWAAARLDDLANLVPARLTALLLVAAAGLSGEGVDVVRRGLVTVWQDARLHPSPNAGWPEAAVAGLLGVRLGGENRYRGRRSCRPFLGRAYVELTPAHIRRTVALMQRACTLATAGAVLVRWWCRA
jgi:adenosylcobinamide-phosphate synthase